MTNDPLRPKAPPDPPRDVGRPRLVVPTCPVSTRLPAPVFDRLTDIAARNHISVSSVLRELVILTLK